MAKAAAAKPATKRKAATTTAKRMSNNTRATARKNNMTMNRSKSDEKPGFTIIEVVLVLAIAGLIFMMVFIALPTLRRSQRDTQRRSDLARLSSQITQYQANNNGKIPENGTQLEKLQKRYLSDNDFADPQYGDYELQFRNGSDVVGSQYSSVAGEGKEVDGQVYFIPGASCDNANETLLSANKRDYAILYRLEAGYYCQSSK